MANKRIQDLEQTTDLTNDDLIPLDTTKKTFATTLKSLTEWLKNTFQTKDNLEQTLSEATDKYPSSKVLKDESSRIVSIMDNKVNKSGDTMSGRLINSHAIGPFTVRTSKYNNNISSDFFGSDFTIDSEDDINHIVFAGSNHTNNDIRARIVCNKRINGKQTYSEIFAGLRADGTVYSYAPQCQSSNSIVTTVSYNVRYVRFGNGLQICWGAGTGVQTFQQPFRDTDYMIADSDLTYHKYEGMWTTNKTTTQFEIKNSGNAQWIAIGYWY